MLGRGRKGSLKVVKVFLPFKILYYICLCINIYMVEKVVIYEGYLVMLNFPTLFLVFMEKGFYPSTLLPFYNLLFILYLCLSMVNKG